MKLSKAILFSLLFFLVFNLILYVVELFWIVKLIQENLKAKEALEFEFWYRILVEKHFRPGEFGMMIEQMLYLKKKLENLVSVLRFFLNPEWFERI